MRPLPFSLVAFLLAACLRAFAVEVDVATAAEQQIHWSFKPLANPVPPETKDKVWPRNPVDRFILARLEKEGLRPAPPAEPVAWLRRVSFDLVGLPPTP